MMLPTDLWFEVIDYLRVTDIVHFRAVRHNNRVAIRYTSHY
jgi:hypothetical protein